MSAVQSDGLRVFCTCRMLCWSLAELIVCSKRGFACILAEWFWPTVMSLSLTYGSSEASCNKLADNTLGGEVLA